MNKWYVIQVMSGYEKRVQKSLLEHRETKGMTAFVEEVIVPIENIAEVKKGQQKIIEKRLWPGYILIKMELNDESWAYVCNTNNVIGFLGGEKPQALSELEVEDILKELASKKGEVVQKHKFEVDDTVKIVDGVFVNFIGKVVEVFHDKGVLSVNVSIFGRDTRVEDLEFWQVEEATADVEGK